MITVVALVGSKRLTVGVYDHAGTAEAVAASWARWVGCKAAIIETADRPPLVLIRPPSAPSVGSVPR
jgi:hypothetical protein